MTGPTTARYDGKCPSCSMAIIAGDEIVPVALDVEIESTLAGTIPGAAVTTWAHTVCPTPRGQSTCPSCFLERPCPCEDGQ